MKLHIIYTSIDQNLQELNLVIYFRNFTDEIPMGTFDISG